MTALRMALSQSSVAYNDSQVSRQLYGMNASRMWSGPNRNHACCPKWIFSGYRSTRAFLASVYHLLIHYSFTNSMIDSSFDPGICTTDAPSIMRQIVNHASLSNN